MFFTFNCSSLFFFWAAQHKHSVQLLPTKLTHCCTGEFIALLKGRLIAVVEESDFSSSSPRICHPVCGGDLPITNQRLSTLKASPRTTWEHDNIQTHHMFTWMYVCFTRGASLPFTLPALSGNERKYTQWNHFSRWRQEREGKTEKTGYGKNRRRSNTGKRERDEGVTPRARKSDCLLTWWERGCIII